MNDEIQDPVREHGARHEDRSRRMSSPDKSEAHECGGRPQQRCYKAVRVRHVIQVEWIRGGESRHDSDLLDPEQDERGPDHIEPLNSDEQQPQWNPWLKSFRGETDAVVTNEHTSHDTANHSSIVGV